MQLNSAKARDDIGRDALLEFARRAGIADDVTLGPKQSQSESDGTFTARPITFGARISLQCELTDVGTGTGTDISAESYKAYLHTDIGYNPSAFVRKATGHISNPHTISFEMTTPYEYSSTIELRKAEAEVEKLERQQLKFEKALRTLDEEKARQIDGNDLALIPPENSPTRSRGNSTSQRGRAGTKGAKGGGANFSLDQKERTILERLQVIDEDKTKAKNDIQTLSVESAKDMANNVQAQKETLGKPLTYGAILQLKHQYTGGYLSVSNIASELAYNQMNIILKDRADRSCFFQVLSRSKVRKMNDQVREGDMIHLLNLDADGHYLAATPLTFDRAHTFGTDGEHEHVNQVGDSDATACHIPHPWTIALMSSADPPELDTNGNVSAVPLYAGDFVRVQHREEEAWLEVKDGTLQLAPSVGSELHRSPTSTLWQVCWANENLKNGKPGCINTITYNKQDPYCLRSAITGEYIGFQELGGFDASSSSSDHAELQLFNMDHGANSERMLCCGFTFIPHEGEDIEDALEDNGLCQIMHTESKKVMRMRPDPLVKGRTGAVLEPQQTGAVNFAGTFAIHRVAADDLMDFTYIEGRSEVLDIAINDLTEKLKERPDLDISSHSLGVTFNCLRELVLFLSSGNIRRRRRRLLEVEIVRTIVDLVSKPLEQMLDPRKNEILKQASVHFNQEDVIFGPETGSDINLTEVWDTAFQVLTLANGEQEDDDVTNEFLVENFKSIAKHMLKLNSVTAGALLKTIIAGRHDIMNPIASASADGSRVPRKDPFEWFLDQLDEDTVSSGRYFDVLRSFCTVNGLAVSKGQQAVEKKLKHAMKKQLVSLLDSDQRVGVRIHLGRARKVLSLRSICDVIPEARSNTKLKYREPKISATTEEYFWLFTSQMELVRDVCHGIALNADALLGWSAQYPQKVLPDIFEDDQLPHSLRLASLQLYFTLFMVQPETVANRGRVGLVHRWRNLQNGRPGGGSKSGAVNAGGAISQFHEWLVRETGGRHEITGFIEEMVRLVTQTGTWNGVHSSGRISFHQHHARFVLSLLRAVKYVVLTGHYNAVDKKQDLVAILHTINSCILSRAARLQPERMSPRNTIRDDCIGEVLCAALEIVSIVTTSFRCGINTDSVLNDYVYMYARRWEGKDARGKVTVLKDRQRLVKSDVKILDRLFEIAELTDPTANKVELTDSRLDEYGASWKHTKAQEAVKSYLMATFFGSDKKATEYRNEVAEICFNLGGSPNHKVNRMATNLLVGINSLQSTFFGTAKRLLIITDTTSDDWLQRIQRQHVRLIRQTTGAHMDRYAAGEISKICAKLDQIMTEDGNHTAAAQICFKEGVATTLLSVFRLQLPAEDATNKQNDPMYDEEVNVPIVGMLVHILKTFNLMSSNDYREMQAFLFQELPPLLNHKVATSPVVAAHVAAALNPAMRNPFFQSRVRESHIELFTSVMFSFYDRNYYLAEFLDLLESIGSLARSDDENASASAVALNQKLIIAALMKHPDIGNEMLNPQELKDAAKFLSKQKQLQKGSLASMKKDKQFRISLVELLAALSSGDDVFIERICKQMIPVKDLLGVLASILDTKGGATNATNQKISSTGDCSICLDQPADMACKPCNHISACEGCSALLQECPICRDSRAPSTGWEKMYFATDHSASIGFDIDVEFEGFATDVGPLGVAAPADVGFAAAGGHGGEPSHGTQGQNSQLLETDVALRVFKSYLKYLYHVYMSAKCELPMLHDRPLVYEVSMWRNFQHCQFEISKFADDTQTVSHEEVFNTRQELIFEVVLPFCTMLLQKHLNETAMRHFGANVKSAAEYRATEVALGGKDPKREYNTILQRISTGLIEIAARCHKQPWWHQARRPVRELLAAIIAVCPDAMGERIANRANTVFDKEQRTLTSGAKINKLKSEADKEKSRILLENRDMDDRMILDVAGELFAGDKGDVGWQTQVNAEFRAYISRMEEIDFWSKRGAHRCWEKHPTVEGLKNERCRYLQTMGEGGLPRASEFNAMVLKFSKRIDGPEMILGHLSNLQAFLARSDLGDQQRDTTNRMILTSLDILAALLHAKLCTERGEAPHQKGEHREKRIAQAQQAVHDFQLRLAEAGAVKQLFRLISSANEQVMKSAFKMFLAVLSGSSSEMQARVYDALRTDPLSMTALGRIQGELSRCIRSIRHGMELSYSAEAAAHAAENSMEPEEEDTYGLDPRASYYECLAEPATGVRASDLSREKCQNILLMNGIAGGEGDDVDALRKLVDDNKLAAKEAVVAAEEREKYSRWNESDYSWCMNICEGIAVIVEGGSEDLKNLMREQEGSATKINFVYEMCDALEVLPDEVPTDKVLRPKWMALHESLFVALSELCQGNAGNQTAAVDANYSKHLNQFLTWTPLSSVYGYVRAQRAALTSLEMMLESNSAHCRKLAGQLRYKVDLPLLLRAGSRFYFTNMFLENSEFAKKTEWPRRMLVECGFKCYFALRRFEDLVGETPHDVVAGQVVASGIPSTEEVLEKSGSKTLRHELFKGLRKLIFVDQEILERERADRKRASMGISKFGEVDSRLLKEFQAYFTKVYDLDLKTQGTAPGIRNIPDKLTAFQSYMDQHDKFADMDYNRFSYYATTSISIEFLRDDILQKVYFRRPLGYRVPVRIRETLQLELDVTTPMDTVRDFLHKFDEIKRKLEWQQEIRRTPLISGFSEDMVMYYQAVVLLLTYVLNLMMLIGLRAPKDKNVYDTTEDRLTEQAPWLELGMQACGALHLGATLCETVSHFVNQWRTPLSLDKALGASYYFLFVLASCLGLLWYPFFYSLHLLHVVSNNDTLRRVVRAVTYNAQSLGMVAVMTLTFVFLFTFLWFLFFRKDMQIAEGQYCSTLAECFATMVVFALPSSDGPREQFYINGQEDEENFTTHNFGRMWFDFFFWIIINTIMMSLVLGIIIDTFSQLRAERAKQKAAVRNSCVICGLPAHKFEQTPGGFNAHIKKDHNMWNYFYMYVYIKQKDTASQNHHELYLNQHWAQKKDTLPFPMGRSIEIEKTGTTHQMLGELGQKLADLERKLTDMDTKISDLGTHGAPPAVQRGRTTRASAAGGISPMRRRAGTMA